MQGNPDRHLLYLSLEISSLRIQTNVYRYLIKLQLKMLCPYECQSAEQARKGSAFPSTGCTAGATGGIYTGLAFRFVLELRLPPGEERQLLQPWRSRADRDPILEAQGVKTKLGEGKVWEAI